MSGGGGSALAGIGAIGAGSIAQGYYANKSRQAAGQAYNSGLNSLKDSQNQALGYLDPYNQSGQTALAPLTGILTGNQFDPKTGETKTLTPEERDNLLYQSPGYRFSLDQQNQALDRSQVARGISLSGGAQKEIAQYTSGLASQYSSDYINQLAQLAGIGQNAATASANTVNNFGSQIADMITNQGLTRANYYSQLGNIAGNTASQSAGILSGQSGGNSFQSPMFSSGNGLNSSSGGFSSAGGGMYNNNAFMGSGANSLGSSTSLTSQLPLIVGGV